MDHLGRSILFEAARFERAEVRPPLASGHRWRVLVSRDRIAYGRRVINEGEAEVLLVRLAQTSGGARVVRSIGRHSLPPSAK